MTKHTENSPEVAFASEVLTILESTEHERLRLLAQLTALQAKYDDVCTRLALARYLAGREILL